VSEPLIPVVADTREGLPYAFNNAKFVVTRKALPSGDYSLLGFEETHAIERKTFNDLLGSLTGPRDPETKDNRFGRELKRLKSYEQAHLIIESDWRDLELGSYPLVRGRPCSRLHPNALSEMVVAIGCRFTHVWFAGDRAGGQSLCARLLRRWYLDAHAAQARRAAP
jgi:DNA excision repair protein ERCC-4